MYYSSIGAVSSTSTCIVSVRQGYVRPVQVSSYHRLISNFMSYQNLGNAEDNSSATKNNSDL